MPFETQCGTLTSNLKGAGGLTLASIGVRKWAERLFLLQAALDIYLVETKRLEEAADSAAPPQDQEDSESSLDVEYPRLQVLVHPSPREASADETGDGNLMTVTSEQLWDHFLKRGGPADHFDHLVRLTRSTRQSLGMISKEEWERVRRMLSGWDLREGRAAGEEESEKKEETGWEDEHALVGSALPSSKERHPLDGHRVEALLAAARDILGLTANIKSLSLTSFLHRALSAPTLPQSLRSLVIGPRTSYWDDVLPSVGSLSAFKNLKRLRLVGKITEHDAFKLAYEIPSLREVEWEMPERSVEKSSTIYDTIKLLQGPHRFGDEDASGKSLEAGKTSSTDSSFISQSKSSCPSRLTTIHLYRHIIIRMLALASLEPGNFGNLEAWEKGSSVPGALHRIKIADSDVLTSPAKLAIWEEKDFGTLMKRSSEWWEEGGKAGGKGE